MSIRVVVNSGLSISGTEKCFGLGEWKREWTSKGKFVAKPGPILLCRRLNFKGILSDKSLITDEDHALAEEVVESASHEAFCWIGQFIFNNGHMMRDDTLPNAESKQRFRDAVGKIRELLSDTVEFYLQDNFLQLRQSKLFTVRLPDKSSLGDIDEEEKSHIMRELYSTFSSPYLVFRSPESYIDWVKSIPTRLRCFNEVDCHWNKYHRIKFDLDGSEEMIKESGKSREEIFGIFLEALRNSFPIVYGENDINADNIVVCDSSNTAKFSRHITIIGYLQSNGAKLLHETILSYIANHYQLAKIPWASFIDPSPTVQLFHNLRVAGCSKIGANRFKRIISERINGTPHTFFDSLICEYGENHGISLISSVSETEITGMNDSIYHRANKVMTDLMFDSLEKICPGDFGSSPEFLSFGVAFSRFHSKNKCPVCLIHHARVPAIIRVVGKEIVYFCNRASAHALKDAPRCVIGTIDQPRWMMELSKTSGEEILPAFTCPTTKLDLETSENESIIFGDHDTIMIRSGMGTGKSKMLRKHIKESEYKSVVIVSFRRTYTSELVAKFRANDIEAYDYREAKGERISLSKHKLVVIQFESLHLLDFEEPPELLVLDESESIFNQEENPVMKRIGTREETLLTFEALVIHSKRVIALDAYLGRRTIDLLSRFRKSVAAIENRYQSGNDKEINIVDEYMFLSLMLGNLRRGQKFVLVTSKKKYADTMEKLFKSISPDKKIRKYTVESTSEDRRDFSNLDESWVGYDVIIYTSTVLAGCSFEIRDNFKFIFGYFSNTSVDERTALQMFGRVRDAKFRAITFSRTTIIQHYIESIDDIARFWLRKKSLLTRNEAISKKSANEIEKELTGSGIRRMRMHNGEYEAKEDLIYWFLLNNLSERMKSRNRFVNRFIALLEFYGYQLEVDYSNRILTSEKEEINRAMAVIRTNLRIEKSNKIGEETTLSAEAIENLLSISNKSDATLSLEKNLPSPKALEMNIVSGTVLGKAHDLGALREKVRIAKAMNITTNEVTPDIAFATAETRVLKNCSSLNDICRLDTMKESLEELKKIRAGQLNNATNRAAYADIRNDFMHHSLAIKIMDSIGLEASSAKTPLDCKKLTEEDILGNRKELAKVVASESSIIRSLIGHYTLSGVETSRWSMKKILGFTNSILGKLYGVRLTKKRSRVVSTYSIALPPSITIEEGKFVPVISSIPEELPEDMIENISVKIDIVTREAGCRIRNEGRPIAIPTANVDYFPSEPGTEKHDPGSDSRAPV